MEEIETLRVLVNERLCAAAEEILALFGRTIAQYQQEIHELRHKHIEMPISPLSAAWINKLCDDEDDDDPHQPQCDEDQPQITDQKEIKLECDADVQMCGTSQPSLDICLVSPRPSEDTEDSVDDNPPCGPRKRRKAKTQASPVGVASESPARSGKEEQAETLISSRHDRSQPQMCGTSQPSLDIRLVSPQPSEDTEDSAGETHPADRGKEERRKHNTPDGVASESSARSGQEEQAETLGLVLPLTRCRVCGESFLKKRTFMRHVQVHSSECGVCGKHLDLTESLDVHLQVHRTCYFCGKHFEDIMDLERHVRTHTGQKALDCSVCGKGFSNREALVKHMGTHCGDGRAFRCDVCNQTFTLGGNLKQHMKIHTGERPHGCTFCGKTFRLRATLARHVKSHTGEKPHSCVYCGKGFIEKGNLKVHMRTHTGETPYKCCMCGKRFRQLSCFYKHSCHQAAQHGDRVLPYYTKDDQ